MHVSGQLRFKIENELISTHFLQKFSLSLFLSRTKSYIPVLEASNLKSDFGNVILEARSTISPISLR
jgi:hypothetical protein